MSSPAPHYRPSWDDYFMAIARLIATRSTCDRLSAGAVLVKDKRIISTGYNGSPPGLPHCDDEGHLLEEGHCVRTIHGEHNAILQAAAQGGTSTRGSTMYTKYSPCIHCCKYLVAAGMVRVVIGKIYRNTQAVDYLKSANVQVDLYQENPAWKQELVRLFTEEIPTKSAPPVQFTLEQSHH
ncbi:MAG: cytidine/deoxycytidylate deaminase family protein [bacterium]|nr:cytidine/deoxycytidylate deaminase family protein [bacterium]